MIYVLSSHIRVFKILRGVSFLSVDWRARRSNKQGAAFHRGDEPVASSFAVATSLASTFCRERPCKLLDYPLCSHYHPLYSILFPSCAVRCWLRRQCRRSIERTDASIWSTSVTATLGRAASAILRRICTRVYVWLH